MNGFLLNKSNMRYQRIDQDEKENFVDLKLNNNGSNVRENFFQMQERKIENQDQQLDKIGGSIRVLKDMSHHISAELDNQTVILDEFSKDVDTTESKMDVVTKKLAKTLQMSTDRRQWVAICVLSVIIFILFILFFI